MLVIIWFIWLVYSEPPRGTIHEPKGALNKVVDTSRRGYCIACSQGHKLNIAFHSNSTLWNCAVRWP